MSGISQISFITKSRSVHGDKYDYSEAVIDPSMPLSGWKKHRNPKGTMHPRVKIRCKRHNYVFYEYPSKHYNVKRYSTREDITNLPVCCHTGNDLIFLNGGFWRFLTKVEELGRTMTRDQIAKELGFSSYLRPKESLYHHIKKCEKRTHRKIKIKTNGASFDVKYKGKSGLFDTHWGLSLFENGTEIKRECKSCHIIMSLDKFYVKSSEDPTPRRECKDCWKENKTKAWRKQNPHYARDRMKTDPIFKLSSALRTSVCNAIRTCKENGVDATKQDKTLNLLGAKSWRQVFDHLEALFMPGMTWQNHGNGHHGKKEWHIDHIKPIDYFVKNMDFALLEVQRECFNISNLQPLWAADNLSKSNRIIEKDIY